MGLGACSSIHQVSKVSKTEIDKVLLSVGIRVKKPVSEFACDSYLSAYADHFREPLFSETLKCLNSIKSGSATYAYVFEPSLKLAFKEAKDATCMKNIFPYLEVPHELYFVGNTESNPEWQCYSINTNPEAGEFADIKFPWDRFKVEFKFPVSRELKNPTDLQLWLMINLLESMRVQMGEKLIGSMVTENLCKRCYKDTPWFDEKRKSQIPPIYYP